MRGADYSMILSVYAVDLRRETCVGFMMDAVRREGVAGQCLPGIVG